MVQECASDSDKKLLLPFGKHDEIRDHNYYFSELFYRLAYLIDNECKPQKISTHGITDSRIFGQRVHEITLKANLQMLYYDDSATLAVAFTKRTYDGGNVNWLWRGIVLLNNKKVNEAYRKLFDIIKK